MIIARKHGCELGGTGGTRTGGMTHIMRLGKYSKATGRAYGYKRHDSFGFDKKSSFTFRR